MMGRGRQRADVWQRRRRLALLFAITAVFVLSLRACPWGGEPKVVSESEALARVIRSEIGQGSDKQKRHVAWAVRNLANSQHRSIAEMACSPCGPQERGRPVASGQPALDSDRKLARQVLARKLTRDPTGGATHFINPKLQDKLARRGVRGYRGNSYRVVRRRWRRVYGWRPYYRLGPDLELWGPKKRRSSGAKSPASKR